MECPNVRLTISHVLTVGAGGQMLRVDAPAVTAQMADYQAIWNWTDIGHVTCTVGHEPLAVVAHRASVASDTDLPKPAPTAIKLHEHTSNKAVAHWAVLSEFGGTPHAQASVVGGAQSVTEMLSVAAFDCAKATRWEPSCRCSALSAAKTQTPLARSDDFSLAMLAQSHMPALYQGQIMQQTGQGAAMSPNGAVGG